MRRYTETRETEVPFYLQPDRARTPHAAAMECAAKGWTWDGKKYATRDDWEAAILGYKGVMHF